MEGALYGYNNANQPAGVTALTGTDEVRQIEGSQAGRRHGLASDKADHLLNPDLEGGAWRSVELCGLIAVFLEPQVGRTC